MIKIKIPGTPIAKKRPRFARHGKLVITYSDQHTEEGKFILFAREQYSGKPMAGAIGMSIVFVFPRPKSHYGTGRNLDRLKDSAPRNHIKKPDIDNLQKFVKDCLNGHTYNDDSQIVEVFATKRYVSGTEKPFTGISIYETI